MMIFENHANKRLSNREEEVFSQLSLGLSNKDIADNLHISEGTLRIHLKNIYRKFGIDGRSMAVCYAVHYSSVHGKGNSQI